MSDNSGATSNSAELEAMKQEILREMRKEVAKAKQEIIEGKFYDTAVLGLCSFATLRLSDSSAL